MLINSKNKLQIESNLLKSIIWVIILLFQKELVSFFICFGLILNNLLICSLNKLLNWNNVYSLNKLVFLYFSNSSIYSKKLFFY